MKKLLKTVEFIANTKHSGHYTIYKFTTHYKGCYGTLEDRAQIAKLRPFCNLKDLLIHLISQ